MNSWTHVEFRWLNIWLQGWSNDLLAGFPVWQNHYYETKNIQVWMKNEPIFQNVLQIVKPKTNIFGSICFSCLFDWCCGTRNIQVWVKKGTTAGLWMLKRWPPFSMQLCPYHRSCKNAKKNVTAKIAENPKMLKRWSPFSLIKRWGHILIC